MRALWEWEVEAKPNPNHYLEGQEMSGGLSK